MNELIFFDAKAQAMIDEAVGIFDDVLGESTNEADERRLVLMGLMQVLLAAGAKVNAAGRNNLLRTATGEHLDAIGETALVPRLPALAAKAQIEFTLSSARGQNMLIPAGRRVTPDGELFFATDSALIIPAGEVVGAAWATCAEAGVAGNGFVPGAITTLVDPLPYVASVRNITTSAGGSEQESDDSYRARIQTSPASYSTAGSELAYAYWARSAHVDVIDVYPRVPAPGEMEIIVLTTNGEPSQAILDAVAEACSASVHRPLTDQVRVVAPEMIDYDISLTYYAPAASLSAVRTAVEGEGGALQQYIQWQAAQLGRAINPNQLRVLLSQAGVVWAEIEAPEYAPLTRGQAARVRNTTVNSAEISGV